MKKKIALLFLTILLVVVPMNHISEAVPVAALIPAGVAALVVCGLCAEHPNVLRAMAHDMIEGLSAGARKVLEWCGINKRFIIDAQTEKEVKDYIKQAQQYEDGREIEYETGETGYELISTIGTNADWRVPVQYRYSDLRFQKLNFTRAADTIRLSINGYQGGQHKQTLTFQTKIELGADLKNDLIMTAPGGQPYIVSTKYGTYPVFDITWEVVRLSPYEFRMYLVVDEERVHYLEYTGNPEYDYRNYSVFNYGTTKLYDLGTSYGVIDYYVYNQNDINYYNEYIYNNYYSVANREVEFPEGFDTVEDLAGVDTADVTIGEAVLQPPGYEESPALGGIVGWLQSIYNKLSDVYNSVRSLPNAIREGLVEWVEAAVVPPPGYVDNFYNTLLSALYEKFPMDDLIDAMKQVFGSEEEEWEGIKVSFPVYGTGELYIVSPVFVNQVATWIKTAISGVIWFITGLFIIRKLGRVMSA